MYCQSFLTMPISFSRLKAWSTTLWRYWRYLDTTQIIAEIFLIFIIIRTCILWRFLVIKTNTYFHCKSLSHPCMRKWLRTWHSRYRALSSMAWQHQLIRERKNIVNFQFLILQLFPGAIFSLSHSDKNWQLKFNLLELSNEMLFNNLKYKIFYYGLFATDLFNGKRSLRRKFYGLTKNKSNK